MELLEKIETKKAKIGIIGLGYVGLPLALKFAKAGFRVRGFDVDERKIKKLKSGKCDISYISDEELDILNHGVELFTCWEKPPKKILVDCDCIIICVPTPTINNKPEVKNLEILIDTIHNNIVSYGKSDFLIVLESTVYPGFTNKNFWRFKDDKLNPTRSRGFEGYVAFSPERVDPGNKLYTLENTPKIVGGVDPVSTAIAKALYLNIVDEVVEASGTHVAELTKLLENMYRFVNISFMNEVKQFCDQMEISLKEVIELASTKPFGFSPFYPTASIGGECIGVDPYYFKYESNKHGVDTPIIDACTGVNKKSLDILIDKIKWILDSADKPVKGANIAIIGLAYKKNVGDVRNSTGTAILEQLLFRRANITYHDPYVDKHYSFESEDLKTICKRSDAVIIAVDHDNVDYSIIKEYSDIIIDTKNIFEDDEWVYQV